MMIEATQVLKTEVSQGPTDKRMGVRGMEACRQTPCAGVSKGPHARTMPVQEPRDGIFQLFESKN